MVKTSSISIFFLCTSFIDNELTAVGGYSVDNHTNKQFTLCQGQWVEVYPPMSIARSNAACVGISNDLAAVWYF